MNDFLFNEKIDVDENNILRKKPTLLKILLKDRTTQKNIVWATKSYESLGTVFKADSVIKVGLITGNRSSLIRPRVEKAKYEQKARTKGRAEVFTPTWIVKKQNDTIDEEFKDLSLEEYVSKVWLEITCGEAPYMVSRYDTVTGELIQINERVGFVDRKLKRINQEIGEEQKWLEFAVKAYQSSYGYEFQGDSLLLARENLLYTFIDYYKAKFGKEPSSKSKEEIAKIISYNVFQMDGLKYTVPYTERALESEIAFQLNLFGEPTEPEEMELDLMLPGTIAKIKDWKANKMIEFQSLARRNGSMKFDVVIGNPPYQEEALGENTAGLPIYNKFIEELYKLSSKVELITPARFLFNAGQTPKSWNEKMLNDPHLKVVYYNQDSSEVFPNTDIKGGIAITYRDSNKNFGAIETFTSFPELQGIMKKAEPKTFDDSIVEIIYTQTKFNLDALYDVHSEYKEIIGSNGQDRRFRNNIFEKINAFTENQESEDDIKTFGLMNKKREYRYISRKFVDMEHENLQRYKVLVPRSNGSGAIGEVLSTPLIGAPLIGYTQTFIGIGAFDNKIEAENCLKYVKSKFARTMLGILKITQDNNRDTWKKVPLQDFTSKSDIDWTKSISEIDQQLYKKYGLSEDEINFIETKVKEME